MKVWDAVLGVLDIDLTWPVGVPVMVLILFIVNILSLTLNLSDDTILIFSNIFLHPLFVPLLFLLVIFGFYLKLKELNGDSFDGCSDVLISLAFMLYVLTEISALVFGVAFGLYGLYANHISDATVKTELIVAGLVLPISLSLLGRTLIRDGPVGQWLSDFFSRLRQCYFG